MNIRKPARNEKLLCGERTAELGGAERMQNACLARPVQEAASRARRMLQGCVRLRLDSGVQRLAAHRFYEANGLEKTCWHFSCQLT